MAPDAEYGSHFTMRMTPRTRYFLTLAAQLRDVTLSDYIDSALLESFKTTSFDPRAELDTPTPPGQPRSVLYPLWAEMDALWDEEAILRLENKVAIPRYNHLLTDEDLMIWEYLFTQPDLVSATGLPNRRLIADKWAVIKEQALAAKKAQVSA